MLTLPPLRSSKLSSQRLQANLQPASFNHRARPPARHSAPLLPWLRLALRASPASGRGPRTLSMAAPESAEPRAAPAGGGGGAEEEEDAGDFAALGLDPRIVAALGRLGFVRPTPVQAAAVPALLAGGDVVMGAETGSGKTLAYVLPLLQRLLAAQVPAVAPAVAGPAFPSSQNVGCARRCFALVRTRSTHASSSALRQMQLLLHRFSAAALIAPKRRIISLRHLHLQHRADARHRNGAVRCR